MRISKTGESLLVGVLLLATASSLLAAEWSRELKTGGIVRVDPDTNRAMLYRQGVVSQLRDGVHQLKDGSTIEVHAGIMVPTADMLEARKLRPPLPPGSEWIGAHFSGASPCEQLVQRVCGEANTCASATGCDAARQLLVMEQAERERYKIPGTMTYTSGQCMEAGKDTELFVTCDESTAE